MPEQKPPAEAHVTYSRQYRRCKKPGCPSCAIGGAGHGPYWYAYWREGGHQRSRYLGKQAPPDANAHPAPTAASQSVSALRVRTLGGLAVWRGAADLQVETWRPRTAATLLACLLGAPGHRMLRDDLAELLWPEGEPGIGRQNLRATIHHLRRLLDAESVGRDYLRQEGPFLCLIPAPDGRATGDWLDADTFARMATHALAGQDAATSRGALALYGGEYLPEYSTQEWAAVRRDTLREQYLALLLHLAALAEQTGALDEASDCLRRVLAADSCQEEAARALIRVQVTAGRHDEAVRTYRRLALAMQRELGLAPDPRTEAHYQRALESRLRASRARTNLPVPPTSFIGREAELAALEEALSAPAGEERGGGPRLVTVVGPGGCGKSRLAVELGRTLLPQYTDGVWLVELAALPPDIAADPGPLARQACAALGVRENAGQDAAAALVAHLAPRRALLLLDNCEHLVQGCAVLVTALLGRCPDLRILATSRETLGQSGEQVWRLASLGTPEEGRQTEHSLRELIGYSAIRLFVERGRAAQSGFALTEGNRAAVAAICRRLDGLPLAIELAATRVSMLSVQDLAARLDNRFRLLTAGNRGALPRHQTLRAVLDWGYQLLSAPEQKLLRTIAVFAGGWTLEGAEALGADGDADVLATLTMLVDKSLVQLDEVEGTVRYRLLETVRHYALEQIQTPEELEALRQRHAEWCRALAEQAALGLVGPDQKAWLGQLHLEHDNLRAALRWALERHEEGLDAADHGRHERQLLAMQLVAGIWRFWLIRGHVTEGRSWLDRLVRVEQTALEDDRTSLPRAAVLAAAAVLATEQGDHGRAAELAAAALDLYRAQGDRRRSATALDILATTAMRQGDYPRASALYEESLAIFRAFDQQRSIATVLNNLGLAARYQGDFARAAALYEESLAIKRALGDIHGIAVALNNLGDVALDQGNVANARALFEQSLISFQEQKGQWGIALLLTNLGNVARAEGDYRQAAHLYRQSLALYRDLDNRVDVDECLEGLAAALGALGELHRAVRLLGAVDALRATPKTPPLPRNRADLEHTRTAARAALGDGGFAAAWAAGQAATRDEAITLGLQSWYGAEDQSGVADVSA